jgi:hypothetical protein
MAALVRGGVLGDSSVVPPASVPAVNACSGTYSFDFNATIQSGADPDLVPGKTVYSQYWFRNPGSATGAGTSEALQFTIEP